MDELEERVYKFNSLSLPGQPMGTHMGTSYLVNDLWREVKRLRGLTQRALDETTLCPECGVEQIVTHLPTCAHYVPSRQ